MFVNRLKIYVLLSILVFQAGCGAKDVEKKIAPPAWEPDAVQLSATPDIDLKETVSKPPLPDPFTGVELAAELAQLASEGASEIARLQAEVEVEADFPGTASAMLEETTAVLKRIADEGYQPLEIAIADEYSLYTDDAGKIEDNINLGESMEYVLGRDIAGYYQMNSTRLNELKKAYWDAELAKLREELAGFRARFRFAVETRLLAQAAQIGRNQRDVIQRLEDDFRKLADEYAKRVSDAIAEAAAKAGFGDKLPMLTPAGFADRYNEFDREFNRRFEKTKTVAGGG